jgi:hypothetical protein
MMSTFWLDTATLGALKYHLRIERIVFGPMNKRSTLNFLFKKCSTCPS